MARIRHDGIAISEAEFQRQVIAYAQLMGWRVAHFRPGLNARGKWQTAVAGNGVGFPDLVLLRGTQCVVAELKVGRNNPTLEQQRWLLAFSEAGFRSFVFRPEHWATIEEVLR